MASTVRNIEHINQILVWKSTPEYDAAPMAVQLAVEVYLLSLLDAAGKAEKAYVLEQQETDVMISAG